MSPMLFIQQTSDLGIYIYIIYKHTYLMYMHVFMDIYMYMCVCVHEMPMTTLYFR